MSKRLEVLLDDEEHAAMQDIARRRGQTPGEFVREAVRSVISSSFKTTPAEKLQAIRTAVGFTYPIGAIEDLLESTDKGE